MLPAKVIPDKNVAYVCHNGEEHPKGDFEVSKTRSDVPRITKIPKIVERNSRFVHRSALSWKFVEIYFDVN